VGDHRLDLVELLADRALGDFHIVPVLEIHPELRARRCRGLSKLVVIGDFYVFRSFMRKIWPFYAVMFLVLMLVTYIPALSLWLPGFVIK
jgi:hypothetical protein